MNSTTAKPRLLVVTSTFPRWPDDHDPPFVHELARRLTARYEVTVLAPHAPGTPVSERMDGIDVVRFRYAPEALERLAYDGGIPAKLRLRPWLGLLVPLFVLAQTVAVARLLRRLRPDTLHAHWLLPQGLVALLASRLCRRPPRLVVTAHGADLHGFNSRVARWLKRRVLRGVDAVSVVSNALSREAQALAGVPVGVSVIPMGVDLQHEFIPGAARPHGRTLLFAGRLVEKKGLVVLIEAMAVLLRHHPDCRLLIAGSGPLLETLQNRARELGVDSNVRFVGSYRNRDLPSLMHQADVAVYPFVRAAGGDQEGLGLVMVEAMGCGLPVVASDLAAVHDVIEHERTGLLVPPGDADTLAAAIIRLLDDADLAELLARNGRQHAVERFDWQSIATRYAALLSGQQASHG